jgi:hypothetical protein
MDELKPCPFCGNPMHVYYDCGYRLWMWHCGTKNCAGNMIGYDTEEEAAAALNRRPAPENKHHLLDTIHDLRDKNNRLRTEIERMRNAAPENKPLTLEQLRQMDFRSYPIWDSCLNTWCVVRTGLSTDGKAIYYFGGGNRPLEANRFYARKPEQEAVT